MAAARRTPKKTGAKRPAGGRGAVATVLMVVFALLAITALPLCIILLAGLVPTMVSIVVDRYRARYLTRTVGAMNIAGIAPMIFQLWAHGFTMADTLTMLQNPMNWLIMYGAAALGWGLFLAMPPLARVVVDIRADQQQAELKTRAKNLVAEWGEDVTGRSKAG